MIGYNERKRRKDWEEKSEWIHIEALSKRMHRSVTRRRCGFSPYGDRARKDRYVFINSPPWEDANTFASKGTGASTPKYFDCTFGIEQGPEHSQGEEVVSASVQSLIRRLDQFAPVDFDILVTDEAHHAAALS